MMSQSSKGWRMMNTDEDLWGNDHELFRVHEIIRKGRPALNAFVSSWRRCELGQRSMSAGTSSADPRVL
jgi:hypothetical protein